jgi:stearoyl-CoA desaturase (delta-9 desaturase)
LLKTESKPPAGPLVALISLLDADYFPEGAEAVLAKPTVGRWHGLIPFVAIHLLCLGVFWVGWSWTAVTLAVLFYVLRMFFITGFYHRYFSHRTFSTSRAAQFVFAVLGATAGQRGALWWAYHHRDHHRYSDKPGDPHSAMRDGFYWSHIGWITSENVLPTDYSKIRDFARFPELVWINRFDWVVSFTAGMLCYVLGEVLKYTCPALGTNGPQIFIWSLISTVFLYHGTFAINSLAHLWGTRRFQTDDESKNNFWLALITLGEGWHNNHHKYPGLAHQGLMWWEIDFSFYGLKFLELIGVIWDVHQMSLSKIPVEKMPMELEFADPSQQEVYSS